MKEIYFDNAATTRVFDESAKLALEIMTQQYGNPSSVHGFGFKAEMLLKAARRDIMKSLGADERSYNLTFTASGTEADNLAILGYAKLSTKKGNRILIGNSEHPAVFECISELQSLGYEVILVPNKGGEIDFEFVKNNLNEKTVLISHMYINNETGAVYDIKELCKIRDRLSPKCVVHTDAVQAFLKTKSKLVSCGADMISVSGHKIHAPKGVGALLTKKNIRLAPVNYGGGQESGLRSGTEALPLICAFAYSASTLSVHSEENFKHVKSLRDYLANGISELLPEIKLNIPADPSPYILSISLNKIKSEVMLRYLSDKGIYVSAGSACSSKHKQNRVLNNFGLSDASADSTLRISFSEFNTTEEIDTLLSVLCEGCSSLARIK